MNTSDILQDNCILQDAIPKNKTEAIRMMISALCKTGAVSDAEKFMHDVESRESKSSTAIGMQICTPHAKSDAVNRPALCTLVAPHGVDCAAPDGKKVKLFFLIAAPAEADNAHITLLSGIMQNLSDPAVREALIAAKDRSAFRAVLEKNEKKSSTAAHPKILAVTACPTGIAHTFMAAKALEEAAQKADIPFKCETNGSGGAKNVLTEKEIAGAEAIIIAADKEVECERFDGKRILFAPVGDGIRNPDELLRDCLSAPVYHVSTKKNSQGVKRGAYKHLMNGVSRMLPFVVGGGIMIAIAFLIDAASGINDANANFGSVTRAAAFFKEAGGMIFAFMLPILAGYISQSIAGFPGLVAGAAGAAMATSGYSLFGEGGTSGGFIGALAAGFLAGYVTLALIKAFGSIPESISGIRDVLLLPVLSCTIVTAIISAINPAFAFLNDTLYNALDSLSKNGNIILLCALLGGMMAIDMGGPFNKAAYAFATVNLSSQSPAAFIIMASVMAGGMIPPLCIALSTTFSPSKWTDNERKGGAANYIMGLSFISEGAIPYASADPLRVIPSCVVGAASAGALSAFFGCTLRAPHGGIFVLPTIGSFGMYALAILAGSIIGAIVLTALKKPIRKDLA